MTQEPQRSARPAYTHGHEAAVLASHAARTAENSCGYLLPHLDPGAEVLDVGCGPGSITADLAERVAPGRVVGIEPTEEPLRAARETAAARGVENVEFLAADVYDLPFAEASFDVAHAHQVLQHLPDPVGALRAMRRAVRPGGLVAVRDADYSGMFWHPRPAGMDLWMRTYQSIARANGGEPEAGRRLRAWARAAGLEDVRITVSTWVYATPETVRWWGTSQAARIDGPQFRAQAARQGVDDAAVDGIVAGWTAWSEDPDATFVMPHAELLVRV